MDKDGYHGYDKDTEIKRLNEKIRDEMNRDYIIAAQQFSGELYIKASDHHRAVRAAVEAEREACCGIVYGQCGSDNVAQRTVDAIKARGNAC